LRAVDFFAVRRFAGLRAAVFFAVLLRVRLLAGGTVTYLSLTVCWLRAPIRLGSSVSGVHLLLEIGTH
jgi:hypothetical protein